MDAEAKANARLIAAAPDLLRRLRNLLKVVGAPGTCKGCGAAILWVTTKNGKAAPYDPDGETHWATCPNAKRFKK